MPTPRSLNNARTHTIMAEKIGHSNNLFYSGRASATNIGNEEKLAVKNTKWYVRTFFGLRL